MLGDVPAQIGQLADPGVGAPPGIAAPQMGLGLGFDLIRLGLGAGDCLLQDHRIGPGIVIAHLAAIHAHAQHIQMRVMGHGKRYGRVQNRFDLFGFGKNRRDGFDRHDILLENPISMSPYRAAKPPGLDRGQ